MAESIHTNISQGGRVVIPAEFREKFGISVGDEVQVSCDDYGVHITKSTHAWNRLRDAVSAKIPKGVSLVDELIAERRRQARQEFGGE